MDNIKEQYQDNLIYIFTKEKHTCKEKYLVIVKDECPIKSINDCIIMHYSDDFETFLKFTIPTKNRKTKQIISLPACNNIIDKINYGVLSFNNNDLPYSVALNHICINNHFYFHCATSGYKLTGINKRATYLIVEDLGINLDVGTHNHNSVAIYGTLREVTDFDTKKAALLQLINDLAPKHPFNDTMVKRTNILELEIDYLNGKSHIR